jgi:hypothetical protein
MCAKSEPLYRADKLERKQMSRLQNLGWGLIIQGGLPRHNKARRANQIQRGSTFEVIPATNQ